MSNILTPNNLTHDQKKAAEAAFRGLPLDPRWSAAAKTVYEGVTRALEARGGLLGPLEGDQPAPAEAADAATTPVVAEGTPEESAEAEAEPAQAGLPVLLRSRQEAIDAGFLIDVTPEAARIGLPIQVGMTKPMWDLAITTARELSEEEQGLRLRDVLMALRLRLSTSQPGLPLFEFPVLLAFPPEPVPKLCSLLALVHGENASEKAVTLVLREEVTTIVTPPQN